jgi:hypothetical protein
VGIKKKRLKKVEARVKVLEEHHLCEESNLRKALSEARADTARLRSRVQALELDTVPYRPKGSSHLVCVECGAPMSLSWQGGKDLWTCMGSPRSHPQRRAEAKPAPEGAFKSCGPEEP